MAALVAGVGFYALSDILLWARIFEAHGLYRYDWPYQLGHREILVGMIAVGVVLLYDTGWWALWYALSFYVLAFGGAADILYYWLDGRQIPAVLPWLDSSHLVLFKPVTDRSLMASAAVWAALCGLLPTATFRLASPSLSPKDKHCSAYRKRLERKSAEALTDPLRTPTVTGEAAPRRCCTHRVVTAPMEGSAMIAIAPVNRTRAQAFSDLAAILKRTEDELERLWPALEEIRDRSFEPDCSHTEGKAGRVVEDVAMLLEGSQCATVGIGHLRRHAAELGGSLVNGSGR